MNMDCSRRISRREFLKRSGVGLAAEKKLARLYR
jgi:hypothetical protein